MAKLTALGTGSAYVTGSFNESFLLETEEGKKVLFDTGGGNQVMAQLEKAGLKLPFSDLDAVFVSHKHFDHALGLLWLINCRALSSRRHGADPDPLDVLCPHEVEAMVRNMLSHEPMVSGRIDDFAHFHVVNPSSEFEIAGMPAVGLESADAGAQQVGILIRIDEDGHSKTLAYCGDCPLSEDGAVAVHGVDVLIHEALCSEAEAGKFDPRGKGHSTVEEACGFAEKAGAGMLVLSHMKDHLRSARAGVYGDIGEKVFGGKLWIPDDLDSIRI